MGSAGFHRLNRKGKSTAILYVGIDLAKNFFAVHGVNAITTFTFEQFTMRTVLIDGEPWHVAADVATALGYRMASDLTRRLDDDEKGTQFVRTPGGPQEMAIVNESGLHSAVLDSNKAEAKRFRKWVTSEVLPSIRKTGGYRAPARIRSEALDKLRLANAMKIATGVAKELCDRFPRLGDNAQPIA